MLLAVTLLAYLPSLRSGYIWDDNSYVTENQTLRSVDGLRRIWTEPRSIPQYYPLVHTTYWIEFRLWGLQPFGFHLTNVLLHGLGAVLLWRVLARLGVPGAWVAATLFALHPVHVESVAWITERKNVLSGACYFGALLAYLHWRPYRENEKSRTKSPWFYVLSLGLFLCGLLSKSVTASLPAAILVITWWQRGRIGWRDVRPLLPMFALGVSLGLHTAYLEKVHVGAVGTEWDFSFAERLLIAGRAFWFYIGKLVWPHPLIFIYPQWQIVTGLWWQYLFPAAAIGLVVVLWLLRKIGRGPLAAMLLFGGTLFPALGFFDVYPMRFSFVADHFQYLASTAIIALLVAGAANLFPWRSRTVFATAIILPVFLILGTLTWRQQAAYRNLESLWSDTLKKNPNAWIAHNNLGLVLQKSGRHEEAITHYQDALRIKPDHAKTHYNWGDTLRELGRPEEALAHYQDALRIKPNYANAHNNLGNALLELGRPGEALEHYRDALRIKPDFDGIHYNLAMALHDLGRPGEALEHYRDALQIKPDWADAQDQLAQVLVTLGRFKEALSHYNNAVRRSPQNVGAVNNLAWLLATCPLAELRDGQRALQLAGRLVEMQGSESFTILDTLAAAHAEMGNFEEAVWWQEKTVKLAPGAQADAFRQRLNLYRQGKPFRQMLDAQTDEQ